MVEGACENKDLEKIWRVSFFDKTLILRALPQSPSAPAPSRSEPLRVGLLAKRFLGIDL